jgi:hypothetical protein
MSLRKPQYVRHKDPCIGNSGTQTKRRARPSACSQQALQLEGHAFELLGIPVDCPALLCELEFSLLPVDQIKTSLDLKLGNMIQTPGWVMKSASAALEKLLCLTTFEKTMSELVSSRA